MRDKQIKAYGIFLFGFVLLLFIWGIVFYKQISKNMFHTILEHDRAIVTSLLEQDIDKTVIAKAVTNTSQSKASIEFLSDCGISEQTSVYIFTFVNQYCNTLAVFMFFSEIFLSFLLFSGTFIFSKKENIKYLDMIADEVLSNRI